MSIGVITIATKHAMYGRYAYNLAVSLRAISPTIPITIIADDVGLSHLDDYKRTVFDKIVTPELCDYHNGAKCTPLTLKYHLYKYSPYEHTIYVDADTIFTPMKKAEELFRSLKGIPFTIANRGEQDPSKGVSEWVELGVLDVPYWYDLSSEFIYFEKNVQAQSVFEHALRFYKEGDLQTKIFAGDKPDEPFLMMGMIHCGIRPHQAPYKSSYWQWAEKGYKNAMQIKQEYYLFSMGGKFIPRPMQNVYNELCKNVQYITGLQTFTVNHKKSVMPERAVI
jgi:hypothetical protein